MSFINSFFGITDLTKEQAVLCPFPHKTDSGETYLENRPSAHVNTDEKLFHCKACGKGLNETQLIQEIFGCDYITAKKVQVAFNTDETIEEWDSTVKISKETASRAQSLGISDTVIDSLKIRTTIYPSQKDTLAYPVEMYGTLLDIRTYNPGHTPKIKSRQGAISGLILPFNNLLETEENKPIFICAGEKDMSIALTYGFNAITITGGERAKPVCPKLFANKKVIILYDNDDAGRQGAESLAEFLYPFTKKIKVVTGFHEVCKEKGEDITDFFMKYKGTVPQLMQYVRKTPWFKPATATLKQKQLEIVNLYQATQPEYLNKLVKTAIQVVGVEDRAFHCPTSVIAEKFKVGDAPTKNLLAKGTIRDWRLLPDNIQDVLHLVDEGFKETQIEEHLKNLMKISSVEQYVSLKALQHDTVYKVTVIDLYEQNNNDIRPMEFNALILGQRLESGKKYLVTHKMCPHPYHGQQLTMVITDVEESNDSVTTFKVDDTTKENLKVFQEKTVDEIAEKMKGNIGFDVNLALLKTIDLAYHTPLMFNFNERNKNIRATLDTLVISESRVGKSSTAKTLQEVYGLGTFVSLAGNAATIAGLVGGSSKVGNNNYQTRAGIIPQNHKGLLILEELGKANNDLMRELTDVRSSSQVRITRVSGSIQLPAMLRMIALTNPKPKNGVIKPIAAYPNGIAIVTELVSSPEDIARYDLIHIVSEKGAEIINPLWQPEEPFTNEQYRTRIKWIWSRTAEQIIISPDVQKFIIDRSNDLNKKYGAHIKIFGTETWKKLSRLAIAIAGYTVSTDESFENIIVTKTHVNEAINTLVALYDNSTFRLKEFVDNEKLYIETDDDAIAVLQDIFTKNPALIYALNTQTETNASILASTTGLDRPELNKILQRLAKAYFIKFDNNDIIPTARYRLTVEHLDKNVIVDRVGETLEIATPEEDEDDDF